ncbi:hypothetical protein QQP08_008036 [Theobroma cacao]|nr:hypothetical protein QQP08_008036 [Theobroma cacao]
MSCNQPRRSDSGGGIIGLVIDAWLKLQIADKSMRIVRNQRVIYRVRIFPSVHQGKHDRLQPSRAGLGSSGKEDVTILSLKALLASTWEEKDQFESLTLNKGAAAGKYVLCS